MSLVLYILIFVKLEPHFLLENIMGSIGFRLFSLTAFLWIEDSSYSLGN